jgi:hypothetical protein
MMKQILKDWLLAHSDCAESSSYPDILVFDDHATIDINVLATFILENPTTD